MCKEFVWSAIEKSRSFVKSLFDSEYGECEIKLVMGQFACGGHDTASLLGILYTCRAAIAK